MTVRSLRHRPKSQSSDVQKRTGPRRRRPPIHRTENLEGREVDLSVDYRDGSLCVRLDKRVDIVTAAGPVRVWKWFRIRGAAQEELAGSIGQALTLAD